MHSKIRLVHIRSLIAIGVAFLAHLGAKADKTWTGGSAEETKYWSDAENWDSGTGAYYIGSDTTVVFSEMTSGIASQVIVGANVVFSASSSDCGLSMQQDAGHALVGKINGPAGTLVINGGTYHFANDLCVGTTRANGTLTLNRGRIDTMYWMALGAYDGNCTSIVNVIGGELVVGYRDGKEVNNGRLVIGQKASAIATFNQTGGRVRSSDNDHIALEMASSSGATATYNLSGGTYDCHGDILLGNGGTEATINISGTGVLNCETPEKGERWIKVGSSGSGTYKLNLNGGTLNAWRIFSPSSSGTREVNFNGGKLVVLGTTYPIIGSDNNLVVNILTDGGIVDTNGKNATISANMKGVGTITKEGVGSLTLAGGYFGGLAIASGADAVTTPGGQTLTSGSVFLVSGVNSTLPIAIANTLSSYSLWLEEGGVASIEGVTLDFSSSNEQKLFTVAGLKLLGGDVTEDTNISSYMPISGATAAYKVLYKSSDRSIYAVKVSDANAWKGGSSGGNWSDLVNWTYAVPDANYTVSFDDGDIVTIDSNVAVSGASFAGNVTFSTPSCVCSAALGVVSGSGSLTKVGDGMLSVSGLPEGGAVVSAGTLVVPRTVSSTISVAQGGLLLVDVSELELSSAEETQINFNGIAIPAEATDPSLYVGVRGKRAVCSFEKSGETWTLTTVRLAGGEEMAKDYWVAGSASTDWSVGSNWSSGAVPGAAYDAAVFPCDAKIVLYDGFHTVRKLVIATGSMVKFWSTNAGKYPTLYVGEATGGTLNLSKFGLIAQNEVKDSGGADVRCDVVLDPTVYGANQDCWIEGNVGGAVLNFYGTLYATNSAFRVNRNMNLYGTIVCGRELGDDNYFANSTVKSGGTFKCISGGDMKFSSSSKLESGATILAEGGTITVEGGSTLDDGCSILANGGTVNLPWCELASTCTLGGTSGGTLSFSGGTVACDITGSPNIAFADTDTTLFLTGDNSGFSGTVSGASAKQKLEFASKDAGSANAVFNNSAAVTWNFKHAWHEVLYLGALNATDSGAFLWVENGGPVIEVGAKDDSVINSPFTGSNFTLRKVNADTTLTLGSSAAMVEGSTVELVAGALTMPIGLLQDSKITVVVTDGNLVLDGSTLTEVVPGTSYTLSKVTLPEGVEPEDFITIANTDYHWSVVAGDDADTIVIVARHNTWKGGESGNWNDASSWTDGIPSSSEIVQFDAAVEVSIAADVTVAGLVANAAVTFNDTVGTASVALGAVSGTGTIAKKGVGLTKFTGTFDGIDFAVESGVASVPKDSVFGTLAIGKSGALVVDIGTISISANDDIGLVSATEVETGGDALADAILIRGSAGMYSLSLVQGVVKATYSEVFGRMCEVRVWEGVRHNYLDQNNAYYGSAAPNTDNNTGLCDAVVVCGDATCNGYSTNTEKIRYFYARGGVVSLANPNNNNPSLKSQYFGGNGTLRMNSHGFKRAWGRVIVSDGLTIDVASSTASWFGAEDEGDDDTKIMDINADVYCTNGYMVARIDTSINAKLVVGGSSSKVEIQNGAHIGANAELVIADGLPGTFENNSGESFSKVTITGGAVAYSALPSTTAETYLMTGGILTMTLAEATSAESKKVNVTGGKVMIDVEGSDASVGESVTLSAVNIGDGVEPFKTITFSNYGNNDWSARIVDNKLVAEVAELSNINEWIGGAVGEWNDSINWHYGVPSTTHIAKFDSNATVGMTSEVSFGGLLLTDGAHVAFHRNGGEKFHIGTLDGSGKITLNYVGLTQTIASGSDMTVGSGIEVELVNGGWLGDWNSSSVMTFNGTLRVAENQSGEIWKNVKIGTDGKMLGKGTLTIKSSGIELKGDMSNFEGTVTVYSDSDSKVNIQPILFSRNAKKATFKINAWNGKSTLFFEAGGANYQLGDLITESTDLRTNAEVALHGGSGAAATIIEVGYLNNNSTFAGKVWDPLSIVKVGTGVWTMNAEHTETTRSVTVRGGELKLVHDLPGSVSLSVESAGTLSGSAALSGTLSFERGATMKQTVTGEGTAESPYSCPALAVSGEVNVAGVKFGLSGLDNATMADTTFTLLTSGASVTGKPQSEEGMPSSDGKGWKARKTDRAVVLEYVKLASGVMMLVF